ncbi:hypothetical protein KPZU09_56220 [Klebsiella pneumoniae]|uniref:Cellulose synthase operon protein C n=1 Tax=Klebsiella pneumoniae TaxID=573 RepID=A0A919LQY7_KLEPN|nr:hypothetical protein KPZU09_56220 [Klebsiella pneumoniae]
MAQLSKAIAMDPDSPNRGKWDSLLQTNRYWLLIKQGDNALKAGQLSQAQNYYARAQRVDRTDSYAVLGLGTSRRRAKRRRRRSAITSRRCARIAAITAVRGRQPLSRRIAGESQRRIAGLPPAQRRSIDDIERSLTNDRLEKQAQALESRATGRRRRKCSVGARRWIRTASG